MFEQSFNFIAGDTTELTVLLTKDNLVTTPGTPWNPGVTPPGGGATHNLIFTAKRKQSDHDELALFQYASGAGIVHGTNLVTIKIHPSDSRAYGGKTLYFDIQAQDLSTGDIVSTVAAGSLVLKRDVTRQTTTSVPVHTLSESVPHTGPVGATGPQGIQGPTGPQGGAGPTGATGAAETTASILAKLAPGTGGIGVIGPEYHADALSGAGVPINPTFATGTAAIPAATIKDQTVIIAGVVYRFNTLDTPYTPQNVAYSGSNSASAAQALASRVTVWVGSSTGDENVTASRDSSLVTFTSKTPGIAGNNITLAAGVFGAGSPIIVVSGGNLTGGIDGTAASYIGQLYRNTESGIWYRWTGSAWQEDAGAEVVDAITNGDMSAVTSNAVYDMAATKAPLASPNFTGNVETDGSFLTEEGNFTTNTGQFSGAGTGLTGTAAGFTAGNVTTINGKIAAGANTALSGAGTAASPYIIAATGGATTWSALTDNTTAPLSTDNTPLATALAGKAAITYNTAAPNATTNVAAISAAEAASSNADLVLSPKGTGAILTATPNNAVSGGNKRGLNAVDLQRSRAIATQVATGAESVIVGGNNNTTTGTQSGILAGSGSTASGNLSFIGGGQSNTAAGNWSVISGGSNNATALNYSTVSGGGSNTASGTSSTVPGGENNTASGNYSLAAGRRAKATLTGAMVLSDSTNADVTSAVADGFTFRFAGGYSFLGGNAVFAGSIGTGGQTWNGATITGPQSFTGQVSSSGSTSTASSTNLLNMATNDVRYAAKPLFSALTSNVDIVSNVTPATCGVSVVVAAGTYRIVAKAFCQVITGGSTAGGCLMQLSGVTFSNIGGLYGKRASHGSLVLEYALGVNSTAPALGFATSSAGSDFSDSNWYTSNFGGVWVYLDLVADLTAGTVEMKISQFTSHPTLTRFRANNTFMQLEKLS